MTKLQAPCNVQNAKHIAEYYRNVSPGDVAVVRNTHGHFLEYRLDEITGTNPKRGRVYLKQEGAFYAKNGKNCFHPTGQSNLVVPTPEVLSWIKDRGDGLGRLASGSEVDYDIVPPGRREEGYQRALSAREIVFGIRERKE